MLQTLLTEAVGTFLMSPTAPEQFPLALNSPNSLWGDEVQEQQKGDFRGSVLPSSITWVAPVARTSCDSFLQNSPEHDHLGMAS